MRIIQSKGLAGLALIALLGTATWSQTPSPTPSPSLSVSPTPSSAAGKSKSIKSDTGPRPIDIHSDKLDYDEKKKKVRLIGKVKINSDNMTITSPYAEFFTDKKTAEFQGGVKMVGEGSTATGRHMDVFYNDQRAILTGDVRMVSEKGLGAQPGSPTVILCEQMDYLWVKGVGKAKGRVKVRQGNRRAFADRAIYYRLLQKVYLEGNVQIERGADEWLLCEKATMDLATDTAAAEGGVVVRTHTDPEKPKKKDGDKEEAPSLARPLPIEPPLPYKTIEVPPPLKLPGVDP